MCDEPTEYCMCVLLLIFFFLSKRDERGEDEDWMWQAGNLCETLESNYLGPEMESTSNPLLACHIANEASN